MGLSPPLPAAAGSAALRRQILRLAWPVVAEQLLGTLAQMVDMMLVGPLGAAAVAAVGLSTQPLWFLMGPFMGLGAGVGALVSRCAGAGQHLQARSALRQGFWLATALAILMGGLIAAQAAAIVRLMGGEPDLVPVAAAYLCALAPGLAALFWSLVMGAALRAAGDTRTPFYISAAVNAVNLALTWALVYGRLGLPALGVTGAGAATSMARGLGALALLAALLRRARPVRLEPERLLALDGDLMRRILRVALPAAGERISSTLAYTVYARLVATLGTVAVAAHYTAVVAEQVSWMLGAGLTTAAATLAGQALGARAPERAQAAIRESVRVGAAAILPLAALFLAFPEAYLRLFTREPRVLAGAADALRVAAAGEVPMILAVVLTGALGGAGDARVPAGISLAGGWAVRLGCTALFLFGLGWGLPGAWAASVLDWTVRVLLLYARFRSGRWQHVQV